MEISLDALINIGTLLLGGGGGAFFTWRWQRAKAEAEAKEKVAEAQSAEVDMAQKVQDTYQEMLDYKQKEVDDNHRLIAELLEDRDHYKQGYLEVRDQLDKLIRDFSKFRNETEDERAQMKRDIARNGLQVKAMRPFLCGDIKCQKRQLVTVSPSGEAENVKEGEQ